MPDGLMDKDPQQHPLYLAIKRFTEDIRVILKLSMGSSGMSWDTFIEKAKNELASERFAGCRKGEEAAYKTLITEVYDHLTVLVRSLKESQERYRKLATRDCAALRFIDTDTAKYAGAFKTPSLRNVAGRPPYMHAGQFKSISEVLEHYASIKPGEGADASLKHGGLSDEERGLIEKFLRTLSGPIASP